MCGAIAAPSRQMQCTDTKAAANWQVWKMMATPQNIDERKVAAAHNGEMTASACVQPKNDSKHEPVASNVGTKQVRRWGERKKESKTTFYKSIKF